MGIDALGKNTTKLGEKAIGSNFIQNLQQLNFSGITSLQWVVKTVKVMFLSSDFESY